MEQKPTFLITEQSFKITTKKTENSIHCFMFTVHHYSSHKIRVQYLLKRNVLAGTLGRARLKVVEKRWGHVIHITVRKFGFCVNIGGKILDIERPEC